MTDLRYSCFISYRHTDNRPAGSGRPDGRKWADWLHHLLETYDVPSSIVGRSDSHAGTIPSSLYPVFQDEKELPADADLSLPIRAAIEASRCMLVICSPEAVKSRFVAEEILYFKQLGRSARILAIIIAGEPNADDPGKLRLRITPEDECFPEPLRHPILADGTLDLSRRIEPLAADARIGPLLEGYTTAAAYRDALIETGTYKSQEVKRRVSEYNDKLILVKNKILAGVLGVSLSELVQRDVKRQLLTLRKRQKVFALVFLLQSACLVWALVEHHRAKVSGEGWKGAIVERAKLARHIEALKNRLASAGLSAEERIEDETELEKAKKVIMIWDTASESLVGTESYDLPSPPPLVAPDSFEEFWMPNGRSG